MTHRRKKEKTERRNHSTFIHNTVSWIFYHDVRRILEYVGEEEEEEEEAKDTERKRIIIRKILWSETHK